MVKRVALVFPGQGSQYAGMGKELYEDCAPARTIFELAQRVCGNDLLKVMFNGPDERLTMTAYAQPAILTLSLAALEAFKAHPVYQTIQVSFCAGLSLGEYSALAAAGSLLPQDALRLILKRGSCMDEACAKHQGAMAAVLNFDQQQLLEICRQTGAEVANFNSPQQVVITGHANKVAAAMEAIKAAGGKKVIPLSVAGAFHSSLMQSAADAFRPSLKSARIIAPAIPVISNVDGLPQLSPPDIRLNLYRQITAPVQWVATVEHMASRGVTHFVEIGPGNVLKGLIRRVNPSIVVQNIEKPADIGLLSF